MYKRQPDDDIPGQIKFIFNTPDIMGKASVRLYLNDGYEDVYKRQSQSPIEFYAGVSDAAVAPYIG